MHFFLAIRLSDLLHDGVPIWKVYIFKILSCGWCAGHSLAMIIFLHSQGVQNKSDIPLSSRWEAWKSVGFFFVCSVTILHAPLTRHRTFLAAYDDDHHHKDASIGVFLSSLFGSFKEGKNLENTSTVGGEGGSSSRFWDAGSWFPNNQTTLWNPMGAAFRGQPSSDKVDLCWPLSWMLTLLLWLQRNPVFYPSAVWLMHNPASVCLWLPRGEEVEVLRRIEMVWGSCI